jgi:uncharacterized protein YjiK
VISRAGLLGVAVLAATAAGCDPGGRNSRGAADSALLAERATRYSLRAAHPDSAGPDAPIARWALPAGLAETSGLLLTADGRLFSHNDSRGKVFEIDYRRGRIVKDFSIGDPTVHADFEAIASIGDTMLLFTSDGVIYRFREGANDKSVPFTTLDTGLGDKCEFESMVYDSATTSLLLGCKRVYDKSRKDTLIIYRWPIELTDPAAKPGPGRRALTYLAVPMAKIIGSNGWSSLHPSDITIDPFTHNYLILASREQALFEITPTGEVVFARPLPPGHEQAEGIALSRDSVLMISDEARGGTPLLTLYRWRR